VRHLGVAAGVVGDGAEGVGGQGDAEGRQHADRRESDAVEAEGHVGDPPGAQYETRMATTTVRTGMPVEYMPTAMPSMTAVAGPIVHCFAIPFVGPYSSEV